MSMRIKPMLLFNLYELYHSLHKAKQIRYELFREVVELILDAKCQAAHFNHTQYVHGYVSEHNLYHHITSKVLIEDLKYEHRFIEGFAFALEYILPLMPDDALFRQLLEDDVATTWRVRWRGTDLYLEFL